MSGVVNPPRNEVGVVTEPECLGPCEPGTNVTLEGIVWTETDHGE